MIPPFRRHTRRWRTTWLAALLLAGTFVAHGFLMVADRRKLPAVPSRRKIPAPFPAAPAASSSPSKEDPSIDGNVPRPTDVTRRPRSRPGREPLFASTAATSPSLAGPPGGATRRTKRNKYADFSKADRAEHDPFEALVEESERKLRSLREMADPVRRREEEIRKAASQAPPEASRPLEFPNVTGIDPYDPTTFGYVEIGTIVGPHGVHGWTKVQGCTDFPERLTRAGMPLHLKPHRKRAPRKVTLAGGKMIDQDSFLVQLQGVYNRTAALKLKGATLYYATQQDTVVKKDDEMLVSDLVGLQVYTVGNDKGGDPTLVGHVQGIVLAEELCAIPGLLHDQIEVALAAPESALPKPGRPQNLVLIPLVPEIVPKIDLVGNMILLDPPAGLLDLIYVREEKVRIKGLLAPSVDD